MTSPHTVIFGGTKGIGKVLASALLASNHEVSVLGRTAPPSEQQMTPAFVACDFLDVKTLDSALGRLRSERPAIDNLVFMQRFRGNGDSWQGEIATSLDATRRAIEFLSSNFDASRSRSIVLVGSQLGSFIANDQPLSYHLAKGALVHLAHYFATTLGPKGVRVNVVSPGTTIKPESDSYYANNIPLADLYKRMTPLGRMGRAEDVAGVILFLLSPASAFVTGQNIAVDGGVSLVSQESLGRSLQGL